MEIIWKSAFTVAGIGGVAFFVFYLLNKQLLTLPIFEKLTRSQTFTVMMTFLVLVFGSLIAGVLAWLHQPQIQSAEQARPALVATREFFVGRWEVQRRLSGSNEDASHIDFFENGQCTGNEDQFVNGQGRRAERNGTWTFTALSRNEFSLTAIYEDGRPWQSNFRIVDHDRIHNMDMNYNAVRVAR